MSFLRKVKRRLDVEINPLSRRAQFELGEGSDRSVVIGVWPEDGSASFELPAGTLVDVLMKRGHAEPPDYPKRFTSARVRITSGA